MCCNGLFHLDTMTYKEAKDHIIQALQGLYEARECSNIAELILERITGKKRIDRITTIGQSLTTHAEKELHTYLDQLLMQVPVQYVLEEAWFYGMKLYVNPHVLIPRPETEELVDWIVEDTDETATIHILDIGTGSGCIPIALQKALPAARVWAIDVSNEALKVAQKNADLQDTKIIYKQADILSSIDQHHLPLFDIIVSNPPYIPQKEEETMSSHVTQHEPHLALFVPDNNPLLFYAAIKNLTKQILAPGGSVYLELHENLAQETASLFSTSGFSETIIKKDMQYKERMLRVR